MEGVVIELFFNVMFWVCLDNGCEVLIYILGKIRCNYIRILLGDWVKVELIFYDLIKGCIIYCFCVKFLNS